MTYYAISTFELIILIVWLFLVFGLGLLIGFYFKNKKELKGGLKNKFGFRDKVYFSSPSNKFKVKKFYDNL